MTAEIKPRYTAEVKVTGGREGHAVSSDGVLDVTLRRPKTNGVSDGTNPEQLFGAAWGGCFLGALGAVTRDTDIDVSEAELTVEIGLGEDVTNGGNGLMAKISLAVPGLEKAQIEDLLEKSHAMCPYSKATRGNVAVELVAL